MKTLAATLAFALAFAGAALATITTTDVYLVDVTGSVATRVNFQEPVTRSLNNARYIETLVSPSSGHVLGVHRDGAVLKLVVVNKQTKVMVDVLAQIEVETVIELSNGKAVVHGASAGRINVGNQTVVPSGSGWFTANNWSTGPTKFKGTFQISTEFGAPTLGNKAIVNVKFKTDGTKLAGVATL